MRFMIGFIVGIVGGFSMVITLITFIGSRIAE